MPKRGLSLSPEQVEHLFPFYLLINEKVEVLAFGSSVSKLCEVQVGSLFSSNFFVNRPQIETTDFDGLKSLAGQLVILEVRNEAKNILRGQFEFNDEFNQLLFIGSPWFNSVEEVKQSGLTLNDFAYHDPLIDLLHLLKTKEIVNEDLKQLLSTVNRQKNELKKASEEIHDIALFPMQNPDPLFRIRHDGTVIMLNPAAEALKEFVYKGKHFRTGDFWRYIAAGKRLLQEQWSFEAGSNHQIYSFVCRDLPEQGYFNVYGRNITEQKQKEEQLKILSQIAEDNLNGVIITDKYGVITWVNKSFSTLTGYQLSESVGRKPGHLLQGKETDTKTIDYLRDQIENGQPFNVEILNYAKDGRAFWVRMKGQPVFNSEGELSGFFALEEDITERRQAEDKLRTNEEKYRNIIANMNLGLVEVDNNDIITYVNHSFCKMSGYLPAELTGKNAANIFLSGANIDIIKRKNERRKKGIADAYEIPVNNKWNELRWWLISGAPRYNDREEIVGSIGIHLDITDRKKLEAELLDAKVQAEQFAKAKEIFLANMSHEIRTPMNAIMGMSNQLAKTALSRKQKFYLDTVHSASENLLVIINDILDLSKIEAGKLTIENIGFELNSVVNKVVQVITHRAEEKGLALNYHLTPQLAPVFIGDPYRINQVLLNLITNAIKFTEKGSIDITCRVLEDHQDSQLIEVSVIDTGIGMDESYLERLFEKFSQENESVTRKFGGTGLGMSICKQLVGLMGGGIHAQSKKGCGTTISFTLQLKKGNATDLKEKQQVRFKPGFLVGCNVLLVDDNEMNRLVASLILRNNKATVFHAANGNQALNQLKNGDIDLVLMDIQMPEMDGYEATRIIRQRGNTLPVIALTAEAIKGEQEKCLEAGMNDYISKPFKEHEFLSVIARWVTPKDLPGIPD